MRLAKGTSTAPLLNNDTNWTYKDVNSPSGVRDFGRYVSMEIDSSGGLHIVCQDAIAGVLYYGYFADGVAENPTGGWKKIDATSSVGRWTDIKLADSSKTGLDAKPVVTYMDATKLDTTQAVKVAFVEDETWESMTAPSEKQAGSQYKMSLVVDVLDKNNKSNKLAVGFNSDMFAVDFLRGEE